jgi:hypothetical protein
MNVSPGRGTCREKRESLSVDGFCSRVHFREGVNMCEELASAVEKLKEEFGEVMVRVIETATVRIGSDQIEWEYRVVVPKFGILEISNDLSDVLQKAIDRKA